MAMELKHFTESEIIFSKEEAWSILRFFWPDTSVDPGSLTQGDVAFAQALLVEAIDGSYNMGFVEIIFGTFYMKVATSFKDVKKMVEKCAKQAAKHWFKHATHKDLANPKIYENVRLVIKRNFRSAWTIRTEGGALDY